MSKPRKTPEEAKQAKAEYMKQYYQNNKEEIKEQTKQYYQNNKEELLEGMKQYYQNNKEEKTEYDRQYYQNNKEKKNQYVRTRSQNDPVFRLRRNISSIITQALKRSDGSKFGESIMQHLPYTIEELKAHLENLFEPWMSWENYGKWHIDHIIPQSKLPYDTMDSDNFRKCWALDNLQPLEATENIKKGNK